MNFDTVLLAAVTDELNKDILGARIDKVTLPDPLDLVIDTYKDGSRRSLLISAEPNSARIHLIRQRSRPSPKEAPAFCMLLRKYLDGGVIREISQPLGFSERVMQLKMRCSSHEDVSLWIELMGRQSNVVLTGDGGKILGAMKRVTPEMSRLREVRPGIVYSPPPRQPGYRRDPIEPDASRNLPTVSFEGTEPAEKWLMSTFRGVGSLLAREAIQRSPVGALTAEAAWYGLNELLTEVRLAQFSPVVYRDAHGDVQGAYPLPLKSIPDSQQTPVDSISVALESATSSVLRADTFEKERTALLTALRKANKTCERQLMDVCEGLTNSDQSEYIKQSGELLLARIGQPLNGGNELEVNDYFAETPDASRTITIDPSLTIQENAERYFRRFQKARDSKEVLLRRQNELETSISGIESALIAADQLTTLQELAELTESVTTEIRQAQAPGGREQVARPMYDGYKIKSMRSPDGWEILVGENATSNDYLTTKVASPADIWLHARAVPSAHGVIRAQNRPASVSLAAILLAAEQVARRSSAKHAGLVSVDYTLKKYVRKPRGSAPGQVTYANEKTVDVIANDEP